MGLSLLAFVSVRVDGTANIQGFRDTVIKFSCVLECHHMAGEYDYLLKVAVKDTAALEHFLTGQLKTTQGVAGTNTQIVLATMKEEVNA